MFFTVCYGARPERLELDRRRAARALAAGAVDAGAADAADRAFLRLMLRLLTAVRTRGALPGLHAGPAERSAHVLPAKLVCLRRWAQAGLVC